MIKERPMKSILLIALLACVGIGYYAWRQQQNAFSELKQLTSTGVDVTFHLVSRPLLAVDSGKQTLHLLSGNGVHNQQVIPLASIKEITFIEAPIHNPKDNSDPIGPDSLVITTNSGQQIRVGDLQLTASTARQLFEKYHLLDNKLTTQYRKN